MTLVETLSKYDNIDLKGFDESELVTELNLISNDGQDQFKLSAEGLAFTLVENYQSEHHTWGTYFGPMLVTSDGNGNIIEAPSIELITKDVLDYWEKRIDECNNPILKARYAGLVWEFKYKRTGDKPDYTILDKYINALISVVEGDYSKYSLSGFNKIIRAIPLAIRTKDSTLIERAKKALLNYEILKATDNPPGYWGKAFQFMLENKNFFTESEEKTLVQKLEERLERLKVKSIDGIGEEKLDPWIIREAVTLLSQFYKKKNNTEKIRVLIKEVETAYEKVMIDASSLQAVSWLKDVYSLYSTYGFNQEAKELLAKIQEKGKGIMAEMQKFESSVEISKEVMDTYLEFMLDGNTDEDFFNKFTYKYIPNKEDAKAQILKQVKASPFYYMFPNQLFDDKGRVKSIIGNIDDDLEGHIVLHISQNLITSYVFMRTVIQKGNEKSIFTCEKIIDFLHNTPIIDEGRFELIKRGLDAYFSNDYITCIHVLIPQIENAIRNIIELSGGSTLKMAKNGKGFQLRTFDDILRDPIIETTLGVDFVNYLRILFTDQRGWNLRNDVCHGIAIEGLFNQMVADRVLHGLICLGVIKWKK